MRILFVNKFLFPNGGSETYMFELGNQLTKIGHEVQYFGMEHPDKIVGNNINAYTPNIDFHGKNESNSLIGILKGYCNKLIMPFKIIYSIEARKQIRKILDDFKPDVVHLNNINFQITPSIIYEIRKWETIVNRTCKIVFTAHDYQWICPNHMLYIPQKGEVCEKCHGGKYIECARNSCIHGSRVRSIIGTFEAYYYKWRRTYSLVDTIICPSQFLYDKFADDSNLNDKLVIMHNFVVEVADEPDVTITLDLPDRYVLYFGRYDVQKGIRTLIDVCKKLSDIDFVFAGKGPLEDEVNKVDNITNIGFVTGSLLRKVISKAEFSVYPSEWYENCPFSVMESQILGTPVVGSDIGGITELIRSEDGPTGVVFKSGCVEELQSIVASIWNDYEQLNKLTNNTRNTSFSNVEQYVELLLNKVYT